MVQDLPKPGPRTDTTKTNTKKPLLGMVASTHETEAEGLLRVQGQSELQNEALSPQKNNEKRKLRF